MTFFWIDDEPSRASVAKNLGRSLNSNVIFTNAKHENLQNLIVKMVKGRKPDLIIIDHKLNDIKDGSFNEGSTAATMIHETWPDCPIVCVSGVDAEDFHLSHWKIYEDIFSASNISKHYKTIFSIAEGFKSFKRRRPNNIDKLIQLLGIQDEIIERLKSIIPSDIKENLSDPAVIRHVSAWVRKILFERPGFLYDSVWAATFVGIKPESFKKVEALFEDARYSGIFNDPTKPRWWKHKLLDILSKNVEGIGLPWEKGRYLSQVKKSDFSKCYVSKAAFPETVAFTDDTHKERYPMKLKETIIDDSFQDLLYFEELRKMDPA